MERSDGLSVEEIRAYLDSKAPPALRPDHVRAYREAAAVLVAIRDPANLRPFGDAPAGVLTALLGPDLVPATGRKFNGQVMLAPEVRARTIRDLVSAGRVEAALAVNPGERDSPLQAHFERYLRYEAPLLARQTLDELDATLQISVWLAGVLDGVPSVDEVDARAGYLRLLAPFESLAGDAVFRGRVKELDRLRSYIGVVAPESVLRRISSSISRWAMPERQPAVSISGIGGAGKSSLVARFMLEHTRLPEDERIPFGYLDFARTSLDIGHTAGLCRELLRQLDLQFPGIFPSTFPTNSRLAKPATPHTVEDRRVGTQILDHTLQRLRDVLGPRPYVVVLDTFEEVQYRGEERAYAFWGMLSELQDRAPFLRVVVAGRAPVESLELAGRSPRRIELGDLDSEAAMAFLRAQGIEEPQTRQEFIQVFGRLPLSLKLAAAVAARTPGGAEALVTPGANGFALLSASDEVTQAELYGRFLDHIADERIRRLAHPGLTLRRLNPALILEVLNEPCGLGIGTIAEAEALFDELRRESSLVSVDSADGDLVHRPDLRRVMLKMLLTGAPAVVEAIRRRAVEWYRGRDGRRDRAEEIYHRLYLGEPVNSRELADREVRASIQAAIEEFPVEVQLRLADAGLKVPTAVLSQASRSQSHAAVAAQIEQLLPFGQSSEAEARSLFETAYADLSDQRSVSRSVFGPRADRGASPVFRAGARIAAQRGDTDQALDLIERGLDRAARDGAPELTLGLLKERAWLYRNRSLAEQADGLARLAEYARQHQDLPAQIQHRAQSIIVGRRGPSDLAALGDLLSQADSQDLWDLVPALRSVVDTPGFSGVRTLIDKLRDLVSDSASPFRSAVFPDSEPQSVLDEMLRLLADPPRFIGEFLRLCDVWPYRILYVAAPYGRRGEQLTIL